MIELNEHVDRRLVLAVLVALDTLRGVLAESPLR
jgi:hypothetical protein